MGPLSSPANTTAIIAGKASGELACFCPGQLEHESFDSDNAAEGGWERHTGGDISRSLDSWGSERLPAGLNFAHLLAFWKHLFDLWTPHQRMLLQFGPQWLRRQDGWEQHPCHVGRGGACSEDGKARKRLGNICSRGSSTWTGEAVHNSSWFRCSNHEHEDGSQIITQRQEPVSPDSAQLVCPRTNGSFFFFPKHFSSGAPNCLKIRSENIVWASLQQDEKLFLFNSRSFSPPFSLM